MQRFSLREREWEAGWQDVMEVKFLQERIWLEDRMEQVRCLLSRELDVKLKAFSLRLDTVTTDELRQAKDRAKISSSDGDLKEVRGECGDRTGFLRQKRGRDRRTVLRRGQEQRQKWTV
ncbi:hypothetical protein AALO_G00152870 [Alosa alosa]|uniref:Uncharacterized protein n=1 Tax=Alosa alosa TaxID=278164 RepID=A0AAV6GIR0_9TELE|nr:hypothetical protein AALO_G00152870 [Alosa alosa]